MRKIIAYSSALALIASAAQAKEYYVGGPDYQNDMEIVSSYLLGIQMAPMPPDMPMGADTIHLEVDLHATANNRWGYPDQAWIPYVTIGYVLTKEGTNWSHKGVLLPMSANDGPHYADSLAMDGPGKYHVTYTFQPPSVNGYYRHTDAATGIPPWWAPFTESFTFTYPVKG
ncbi:iron transporter [Acidocella sp. KAb 2-4]|uniref:iron transporter n=1 Tax=Acidocella sp. KAb 2-4 TaxID=2885158 RepID=UPI001D098B91|nr:iron transporter [Acidocella sp. KAb 2-4]MCB5945571.1 iron transporter [Acidocella sp. KAb 2-4]